MKKILALFLIFVFFAINPAMARTSKNYLDKLDKYAVWKQERKISIWVEPSEYQEKAYEAFREWMVASNNCVRFVHANSEKYADIRVYFVDRLDANTAGITHHRSNGKYMTNAVVKVRYTNLKGVKLSKKLVYGVTLHEIGHALGIMGHSDNHNDIMYPNTNIIGVHTSDRDANTIREFYCSGRY